MLPTASELKTLDAYLYCTSKWPTLLLIPCASIPHVIVSRNPCFYVKLSIGINSYNCYVTSYLCLWDTNNARCLRRRTQEQLLREIFTRQCIYRCVGSRSVRKREIVGDTREHNRRARQIRVYRLSASAVGNVLFDHVAINHSHSAADA